MTYPSSTDYVSAVQDPGALLDADLRRARLSVDPILQIPIPASGNSAVVFKAMIGSRSHALRFFIRDDASTRERYRGLRAFLVAHGLTDCTAATEWVDEAIVVRGHRWPMVKMEWVEGRTLDAYIEHLVASGNTGALAALAQAWREMVRRMQASGFAHGDLQHGNVLVDVEGKLRLVDFDGSWFAGVTGPAPTESGHPNYQLRNRPWGRWMDTFPGLLIYISLCSLARDPGLWRTFSGRENILFAKDDLLRPFDTEIWSALLAVGDVHITQDLSQLRGACAHPSGESVPLDSLLSADPAQDHGAEEPRTRPMAGLPPLPPGAQWWTQTGQPTGQAASTGPAAAATTLPPPPPKSPFERPTGNGFSAGNASPGWFAPGGAAAGGGGSGAGPVRRPAPPHPPGRPPQPPRPAQPSSMHPPPAPPRRSKAWLWIPGLVLPVIVMIVALANTSSSSSTDDPYDDYSTPATSYPPPTTTYPSEPTVSPTAEEPETAEELLLQHVPGAIAAGCSAYERPAKVVAALECSTDEPVTLRYYQYASNSDMDAAFDSDYRTYESGSCEDDEEGTSTYNQGGESAGRYSCYVSDSDNNVLSWTHDATKILALAISPTSRFAELWNVVEGAGPY